MPSSKFFLPPEFEEGERVVIFDALVAAQVKRRNEGKNYLQCLATPSSIPDGTQLVAFDTTRHPSDEPDDWRKLEIPALNTRVYLQYYIHRYDGPRGSGFIVGCCVNYNAEVWGYERHKGPEIDRPGPFNCWSQVISEVEGV